VLVIGGNQSSGGFEVANSLLLDRASGAKITNTFGSTTNRRTYTVSLWTKKTNVSQEQNLVFAGDLSGANPFFDFRFNSDQTVNWYQSDNSGSGAEFNLITNRKFTDPNSWYHIVMAVDTTQGTSSNRVKLYINGVQQTSFSTETYPSQNFDTSFNAANYESQYGALRTSTPTYDGYICEVVLIDGQQLDPTSFGEFDSDSGVWRAIDVSGLTFGTNGYYLDFEDSSDLGQDVSGNNNDFTLTNIAATDQYTDTCTNNYPIMNILENARAGATFSEGNLKVVSTNSNRAWNMASFGLSQGKWYWEVKYVASGGSTPSDGWNHIGISDRAPDSSTDILGESDYQYSVFEADGKIYASSSSGTTYGSSFSTGAIINIALDLDNYNCYWGVNGQWGNGSGSWNQSSPSSAISIEDIPGTLNDLYFPAFGDGGVNVAKTWEANFGNPPFSISSGNSDANGYGNFEYAVPSGYYTINTKNLAEFG